ncbi:hypothetical protein BC829DRAFT_370497 [Chytridium lagenaria]|nr:hypothetical protein BC829DRAFT_370497 [Chytridium lagenaria]
MSSAMALDSVDIPAQMEAHRLREMEKDAIHRRVIWDGVKMAGVFTGLSGGASLLAQRYWPLYRAQKLPFKLFIVLAFGTGAFFTEADRSAMRADREFAMKFSVSREGELSRPQETMSRLSTDEVMKAIVRNRYEVVAYTWLGTLAGTLAWNFQRRDIAMAQKLINARMTGQVAAIAGFIAAASLASAMPKEVVVDPYYERIINRHSKRFQDTIDDDSFDLISRPYF